MPVLLESRLGRPSSNHDFEILPSSGLLDKPNRIIFMGLFLFLVGQRQMAIHTLYSRFNS